MSERPFMSFGDKCLSIAQDVREVVEISEHTSVRAGSLECDATEVRGVLRNSGAGVPRDLGVGAIIGAEELRCEGSTSPNMLRVVSAVSYREGSAMFGLSTYDILTPETECPDSEKMRIREGGVELCVQQETLPLVRILRSSSNTAKGMHNIFMHVPNEALSMMSTPGVSSGDVYIAYSVSSSSDSAVEARCALESYTGAVYKSIQNSSGTVSIQAPYHVCVKACSRTAFLKESPCVNMVGFRSSSPSNPASSDISPEVSNPMDFVEDGADPKADALASQEAAAERNYRMTPAMVGLAVGCSVAAVIIVIVAFVVVRCAMKANREIIASYVQTADSSSKAAPGGNMTEVAVKTTKLPNGAPPQLKVSGAVKTQQLPARTPKAPQVLATLQSPYSSSTPLGTSVNRADFGARSLTRAEISTPRNVIRVDTGSPMMGSLDRAQLGLLGAAYGPNFRGDTGTPMMRSLDRAELGLALSRAQKQSSARTDNGSNRS
mmetsp:Transcript_39775/g.112859  ORF Transcript_39775/g.112859 Transcript_39775/m.112859 type:complete len:492 (-) Transcript_39775:274-1749(-)